MAERYHRLFTLPGTLYSPGAPLLIAAGALLQDTQSGRLIAQLKLRNLDSRPIKALKVRITSQDTVGRTLGDATEHAYLDLHAARDEDFGQKTPLVLPEAETRTYLPSVIEVAFADNTVWTAEPNAEWTVLPEAQPLSAALSDPELIRQFQLQFGERSDFMPARMGNLWRCACGAINHAEESVCHACERQANALLNVDLAKLAEEKDARLAREETERVAAEKKAEEEKRLAEETAAAAREKRNKIFAIVGAATAAVLAAMLIVTKIIIPNGEYNEAVALMDAGKYDEAIAAFEAMNGYKDSETQISEVHYREANALMDAGNYVEAAKAYQALGDYKDSADKAAEAEDSRLQKNYADAVALMNDGKYSSAYTKLSSLGDYKDSADLAAECNYHKLLDPYLAGEECELLPMLNALEKMPDDLLETKHYRELFESMLSSLNGTYTNDSYRITIKGNTIVLDLSGVSFTGTVSWKVQDGQFTQVTTSSLKASNSTVAPRKILPTENGLNIIEKNHVIEYVKQGN